jgi:hypothetical protein
MQLDSEAQPEQGPEGGSSLGRDPAEPVSAAAAAAAVSDGEQSMGNRRQQAVALAPSAGVRPETARSLQTQAASPELGRQDSSAAGGDKAAAPALAAEGKAALNGGQPAGLQLGRQESGPLGLHRLASAAEEEEEAVVVGASGQGPGAQKDREEGGQGPAGREGAAAGAAAGDGDEAPAEDLGAQFPFASGMRGGVKCCCECGTTSTPLWRDGAPGEAGCMSLEC